MKLGVAAFGEGDYPRAEAFFSEALELQQAIGSFAATNYTLANLGTIARKTGRYPLALTRFGEALDRLEVSPNAYSLAGVLEEIAATLLALGDAAKGARLLGAADELRCSLGLERFPVERIEYDDEVREMRERLGSEGFEANHRIGASLPIERVLEEAREARASSKA
jgi:tetratricopeptide (TPR) repeat protein